MTRPTNERLGVLEQKVTDLTGKVDDIAIDIKELKTIIQTKIVEHGDMKHEWLNTKIKRIETQSTLLRWILPIAGAVLGSLMTFLIIEFLKNK